MSRVPRYKGQEQQAKICHDAIVSHSEACSCGVCVVNLCGCQSLIVDSLLWVVVVLRMGKGS